MARNNRNQVRVIAGRLRGRTISFADSPGLRPTGDRLRETLFSWLQPFIAESRVLDMFAGSGALGIEAASRGASHVTLIEKSRRVHSELLQNASLLGLDNVSIKCTDALKVEQYCSSSDADKIDRGECFDIVFIDPPFAQGLHAQAIESLIGAQCLSKSAHVVIENDRRAEVVNVPEHWQLKKDKTAGEVRLQLYLVQYSFTAD